jgi:hypothetical protein
MSALRWPGWNNVLPALAWLALLALLPWWLGLPLLLALASVVVLLQHRLAGEHVVLVRRAMRWGLPGVLLALQRALGGDAFAWGAALLGALAGYTLLAGVEAWLDRAQRRAYPASGAQSAEWPELAYAPIGPGVEIIELQAPVWLHAEDALADPASGRVDYDGSGYQFVDGSRVDGVAAQAAFSPAGRWFAARMAGDRGTVLWDRERNQRHRLRGWHVSGWYREQPWLSRREGDVPQALATVLGERNDEAWR